MLLLNILPACGELLASASQSLTHAATAWAISLLVVGAHTLAVCATSAIIEAPLAFAIAVTFFQRNPHPGPHWLAPAVAAGFIWRLAFGGSLGFADSVGSPWAAAALEIWRTLPLAILLFYVPLRRAGVAAAEAARLDGASTATIVRRIHWPACRPAFLVLLALRAVDYLHAAEKPLLSPLAAHRASWLLLLVVVTALALRIARPQEDLA